jgi:hypothetical protein
MKINFGPYPDGEQERQLEITVDGYDTWSLDHTLCLILVPALKRFKEKLHGGPLIANEDVPPQLHRPGDAIDWETDEFWFERWDWVLGEMLFAFEYGLVEDDYKLPDDERIANETRANEGRRLFAKYFHNLWD